jgi:hypothetical protein
MYLVISALKHQHFRHYFLLSTLLNHLLYIKRDFLPKLIGGGHSVATGPGMPWNRPSGHSWKRLCNIFIVGSSKILPFVVTTNAFFFQK